MGRALNRPVAASELARELGLLLAGSDRPILGVPNPGEVFVGGFGFVRGAAFAGMVREDSVIITSPGELTGLVLARSAAVLVSANPRFDFARALYVLERLAGFSWSRDEAQVHPTAEIGRNVVLGQGVRIGANSRIHHNVVIGDEVVIGERCVIKSCTVIGEPGFGFERSENGPPVRILHLGGVRIEDDVEIGALNTVVRATLGDTIVRAGVKTDDHVHIAHNCVVGENTFLTACAELSGSVEIGRDVWVAPNVSIMNQVKIGDRALVGLGAVVRKNVPDDDVVAGNPARSLRRG